MGYHRSPATRETKSEEETDEKAEDEARKEGGEKCRGRIGDARWAGITDGRAQGRAGCIGRSGAAGGRERSGAGR